MISLLHVVIVGILVLMTSDLWASRIYYFITDPEGSMTRITNSINGASGSEIWIEDGEIFLAEDVYLIVNGDIWDLGENSIEINDMLRSAKRRYQDRVILVAGNREYNRLRIPEEIEINSPSMAKFAEFQESAGKNLKASQDVMRLYFWFERDRVRDPRNFVNPLDYHLRELQVRYGRKLSLEEAGRDYLDSLRPTKRIFEYLRLTVPAYTFGSLFASHSDLNYENIGYVPEGDLTLDKRYDLHEWVERLSAIIHESILKFGRDLQFTTPKREIAAIQGGGIAGKENIAAKGLAYARPTRMTGGIGIAGMAVDQYFARSRRSPVLRLQGHIPQPNFAKLTVIPGGGAVFHGDTSRSDPKYAPTVRIVLSDSGDIAEFTSRFSHQAKRYQTVWTPRNQNGFQSFLGHQADDGFFVIGSEVKNPDNILMARFGANYDERPFRVVSVNSLKNSRLHLPIDNTAKVTDFSALSQLFYTTPNPCLKTSL